jgi:four helix bundle protein
MPGARTGRAGAITYDTLIWGAGTASAREEGMTTQSQKAPNHNLPHHTLVAYQLCLELVRLVARVRISEPHLRQQARKSAASAALNAAEGAARQSLGEKRRSYVIAHAEACEACAAVEIAGALGACSASDVAAVLERVERIRRVFYPLVR